MPWGVNRRRVVTINDGKPGERSISVACMHCSDAPCMAVCPVDCFYQTDQRGRAPLQGPLHRLRLLSFTPARSARRSFREAGGVRQSRGKMDKCTFCAGGPEKDHSKAEYDKYGRNRVAEGKLPLCAEMCSTKALLAGDGDKVSDIYRKRVTTRGFGARPWGWGNAYGPGGRT